MAANEQPAVSLLGAVEVVDHDGGDEVLSPTMKRAKKTPASTSNSNSGG